MAYNTTTGLSGAASGAVSGGLTAGPWGAVAGGAAGALSGLLGSSNGPDYGKINQILAGYQDTANRATTDYTSQAAALRQQLLNSLSSSKQDASTGLNTASTNYLAELNPLTSAQVADSNKALLKSTLGAVPQAQQQAREALSATTGLGSGYAAKTAADISQAGLAGYQTGRTALEQQARSSQISGLNSVYNAQTAQIAQTLGIDAATNDAIMNSGNDSLKTAYMQALQTAATTAQGNINSELGIGNMNMAQDTSNNNALLSALGSTASTVASKYAADSQRDFLTKLLATK